MVRRTRTPKNGEMVLLLRSSENSPRILLKGEIGQSLMVQ